MKKKCIICIFAICLLFCFLVEVKIKNKIENSKEKDFFYKFSKIENKNENNYYSKIDELNLIEETYVEINTKGKSVKTRYDTPEGFQRVDLKENSFGEYLRNKRLKNYGSKALYYNGRVKANKGVYDSVLDYNIGNQNLVHSADAIMYLRADYLFNRMQYSSIEFSFMNGFKAEYSKWMAGYRIKIRDNEASWHKCEEQNCTHDSFLEYMKMVYTFCSAITLERDLSYVNTEDMEIGDVFIDNEKCVVAIVIDMCINYETGEKMFMLAQGGCPAQQIQILINPNDDSVSPWYRLDFGDELKTSENIFTANKLARFK